MATVIIEQDPFKLTLTDLKDEDAADFLARVDASFRDRGGLWVGGDITEDGTDRTIRQVTWVNARAEVRATFDDSIPQAASELLFTHTAE
jgi:hypothetical protein